MFYLEFLAGLHERLLPRTYLEVGVRNGHSLALSRCPSLGIDPAFQLTEQLLAPSVLVRSTSDQYFESLSRDRSTPFGVLPVDFAFIDGMHHFEFVLRDFIAVEHFSARSSVIAFDDVLPRSVDEAARERHTQEWAGDVFRIQLALEACRPDLVLIRVDTAPTGLLLVARLDPANRYLSEHFEEITSTYVTADPQAVPADILNRTGALAPQAALALPLWGELRSSRQSASGTAPVPVTRRWRRRPVN